MANRFPKAITNGNDLAEALGLSVREGHYHHEGHFYKYPAKFPCVFFDRHGFIVIESDATLRTLARIAAGKVNFTRSVSRIKGYKYREDWRNWPRVVESVRTRRQYTKLIQSLGDDEKKKLLEQLGLRFVATRSTCGSRALEQIGTVGLTRMRALLRRG